MWKHTVYMHTVFLQCEQSCGCPYHWLTKTPFDSKCRSTASGRLQRQNRAAFAYVALMRSYLQIVCHTQYSALFWPLDAREPVSGGCAGNPDTEKSCCRWST